MPHPHRSAVITAPVDPVWSVVPVTGSDSDATFVEWHAEFDCDGVVAAGLGGLREHLTA